MTTPPLRLIEGNKFLVSPSQLSTMKTCPTFWAYKYLHRRESNTVAPARDAGKAFHSAIEVGFKAAQAGQDDAAQAAASREQLAAGFRKLVLPDDEYRTEARYAEVLEKYREHWKGEQFETLGVEVPFAVELGTVEVASKFLTEIRYKELTTKLPTSAITPDEVKELNAIVDARYVGKMPLTIILNGLIDRIITFDRITWVADSKTMNNWGDWQQDEWARAAQPKLYAWALSQLQEQHPELGLPSGIKGFMLDAIVIRKPSTSTRVKLPREEFKRLRYAYTVEQLEETRTNALRWIEAIINMAATGEFLQNENACAYHYGRRCPYWDCCTVPVEQRQMVLQSDLYRDKVDGMEARAAEDAEITT